MDNGFPLGALPETSSPALRLEYTRVYIVGLAMTRDVSERATHPCLMREKESALVLRVGHQKHGPAHSASGIVVKPLRGRMWGREKKVGGVMREGLMRE